MRYFAETFHGWLTVYKRMIGIDAVDGASKAEVLQVLKGRDRPSRCVCSTYQGNAAGMEQFPERSGKMNRSCFTGTPLAAFPSSLQANASPWTRGTYRDNCTLPMVKD